MRPAPHPPHDIENLLKILRDLRDPQEGCDWDRQQTFLTIAPYTIEEAYEVADAISRNDMAELRSELGDLLLQVVYHAQIAEELGAFAFADVVDAVCSKMIRRHPHVYGGDDAVSADQAQQRWEEIKAAERQADGAKGVLDGIALSLPALKRAEKIQKRAAGVGFDWPDASGPRAKIDEEIAEVEAAITPSEEEQEIGDLLFSVVNWARHKGIDAEAALKGANARFEARFRQMEQDTTAPLHSLSPDALEALWVAAKAAQKQP